MLLLTIAEISKFAGLQIAAEAFLEGASSQAELFDKLTEGNGHSSRFTPLAAKKFILDWEVVEHLANTSTGFSGTLFRSLQTGELVMSLRSTEFVDDAVRDNMATNTMEIKNTGFAWGQLADMEKWYSTLRASGKIPEGKKFDVTGEPLAKLFARVNLVAGLGKMEGRGRPFLA